MLRKQRRFDAFSGRPDACRRFLAPLQPGATHLKNTVSNHDSISASTASPERELVGVIAGSLDHGDRGLVPSRRRLPGGFALRAKRGGEGCCGLTFTSHAKRIVCPLCGKPAKAS